ncbi:hypothetical protein J6590_058854 [Homalodisca vitripennis]|nr:hypothetical protein J6590_058854 [Homalodisca vitripennis]
MHDTRGRDNYRTRRAALPSFMNTSSLREFVSRDLYCTQDRQLTDTREPHVVFSGRTQLCVTGVSMDLQALKVGKNSLSSVLHTNDADLRTH